jgi:hypothetical protein
LSDKSYFKLGPCFQVCFAGLFQTTWNILLSSLFYSLHKIINIFSASKKKSNFQLVCSKHAELQSVIAFLESLQDLYTFAARLEHFTSLQPIVLVDCLTYPSIKLITKNILS